MRDRLINFVISRVVDAIISNLNPSQVKHLLDDLIDRLENMVEESSNKFDDNLLPFIKFLRELLDVPDYPDTNL